MISIVAATVSEARLGTSNIRKRDDHFHIQEQCVYLLSVQHTNAAHALTHSRIHACLHAYTCVYMRIHADMHGDMHGHTHRCMHTYIHAPILRLKEAMPAQTSEDGCVRFLGCLPATFRFLAAPGTGCMWVEAVRDPCAMQHGQSLKK